jgi:hypothetical protein
MKTMLIFIPMLALGLLFVWGARKFYYSRPHSFIREDGRTWTWNPDDSFTDPDGATVTDPDTLMDCQADWAQLHQRAASGTAKLRRGRRFVS